MRKIPELLAPVGGWEQLKAAAENGADAVYMGGMLFNARMNAEHFGGRQLTEAVRYAHSKGVKIYMTLNTLIRDDEIPAALEQAEEFLRAGADALIVAELGIASLLRRTMPQMPLHLSTQATVCDANGAREAEALECARVVLARESSLAQIREIACNSPVPIEVFVHGALCMCYSGQCQMSRFQGGRSGNRGGCAQPCRLPYELLRRGPSPTDAEEILCGAGYLLSPKDLCTIDHLDGLAQAGVASLKIEGRMKSPEYVAVVTSIYRKYLDKYQRDGEFRVSGKDREALQQIFSRGDFTEGYLWGNPRSTLLSGSLPKHQGLAAGRVIAVRSATVRSAAESPESGRSARNGKAAESSIAHKQLLTVRLTREIHLGDGVEVRDDGVRTPGKPEKPAGARESVAPAQFPGGRITYIGAAPGNRRQQKNAGKSRREAPAGQTVEIGFLSGQARMGDVLYRISDSRQLAAARKTYMLDSGTAQKDSRKLPVSMELRLHRGQPVRLTAVHGELAATVQAEEEPEQAVTKPMDRETAHRQLSRTGDTIFALSELTFDAEPGLTVRVALLNRLRRQALSQLTEAWERRESEAPQAPGKFPAWTVEPMEPPVSIGQQPDIGQQTNTGQATEVDRGESADRTESHKRAERAKIPGLRALYMFTVNETVLRLAQAAEYQRFYFPFRAFLDEQQRPWLWRLAEQGKQLIAWLSPVMGPKEQEYLKENKDRLIEVLKELSGIAPDECAETVKQNGANGVRPADLRGRTGLSIGNLGQLPLFRESGILLYGDYGLNFYNRADFAWAAQQGFAGAVWCHEAFAPAVLRGESSDSSGVGGKVGEGIPEFCGMEGEIAVGGRIPLMHSAHCPIGAATGCRGPAPTAPAAVQARTGGKACACDLARYELRDRTGSRYPVLTEKTDCRSIIFSREFRPDSEEIRRLLHKGFSIRVYGIDETVF